MASYNVYSAKIGDRITVTRDGRTHDMTVWTVTAAGSGGRAYGAGPRVHAWIRPGGYGDVFDARDVAAGTVQVEPAPIPDTGESCNCRNQSGLCSYCAARALAAMGPETA